MIRRATLDDVATACEFATRFHSQSVHADVPVVAEALEGWMAGLIEGGAVFLSDEGIIGGVIVPFYWNPDAKMAVELFWWAPKEGQALRLAFEAWAKDQGALRIVFSGQVNERHATIDRIFRRAGYRPVEVGYTKGL